MFFPLGQYQFLLSWFATIILQIQNTCGCRLLCRTTLTLSFFYLFVTKASFHLVFFKLNYYPNMYLPLTLWSSPPAELARGRQESVFWREFGLLSVVVHSKMRRQTLTSLYTLLLGDISGHMPFNSHLLSKFLYCIYISKRLILGFISSQNDSVFLLSVRQGSSKKPKKLPSKK